MDQEDVLQIKKQIETEIKELADSMATLKSEIRESSTIVTKCVQNQDDFYQEERDMKAKIHLYGSVKNSVSP